MALLITGAASLRILGPTVSTPADFEEFSLLNDPNEALSEFYESFRGTLDKHAKVKLRRVKKHNDTPVPGTRPLGL